MRTGRTGADAVSFFLKHICRTLTRYELKLQQLIIALETAGTLTETQANTALAFITAAKGACAIFELIAQNSNVN